MNSLGLRHTNEEEAHTSHTAGFSVFTLVHAGLRRAPRNRFGLAVVLVLALGVQEAAGRPTANALQRTFVSTDFVMVNTAWNLPAQVVGGGALDAIVVTEAEVCVEVAGAPRDSRRFGGRLGRILRRRFRGVLRRRLGRTRGPLGRALGQAIITCLERRTTNQGVDDQPPAGRLHILSIPLQRVGAGVGDRPKIGCDLLLP